MLSDDDEMTNIFFNKSCRCIFTSTKFAISCKGVSHLFNCCSGKELKCTQYVLVKLLLQDTVHHHPQPKLCVAYTCISLHIKTFECFTRISIFTVWLGFMSACWREEQPFYFPYNNSVCAVCCPPLVCPKKAILQPVTTRMRTNGHSIHPKK